MSPGELKCDKRSAMSSFFFKTLPCHFNQTTIQPPNFLLQPRSSPIHSHHRRRTPGDSHHRKTPGDSIHRRRGSHYRRRDNHHRRRDSHHRRRDSHHHRLRLMTEKLTVISSLLSTLSFTSLTRSTHLDVPKMKKGV